jgi:predicted DNA-binding transcriptional regulator AlpA
MELAKIPEAQDFFERCRLSEADTAHYIGMSRPWLRLQRMRGTGPTYIRIGRAIRYDVKDLDAWLAKHRVECS